MVNNDDLKQKRCRLTNENTTGPMLICEPSGLILAASPQVVALSDYLPAALIGLSIETLLSGNILEVLRSCDTECSDAGLRRAQEADCFTGIRKDGTKFSAQISLNLLQSATGNLILITLQPCDQQPYAILTLTADESLSGYLQEDCWPMPTEHNEPCLQPPFIAVENISLLQQKFDDLLYGKSTIEAALRESEDRFATLFNGAADSLFILDMNGIILDANYAAYQRLGYTKAEMLGINTLQIASTEFAIRLPAQLSQVINNGAAIFESATLHKNGTLIPVEIHATIIRLHGDNVIFSAVRDISERKQAEEKIVRLAYYDYLTGLPNRRRLYDRLGDAMAHAGRCRQKLAVLFLDLDDFKQINDRYGHQIGDELLQEVALRLRNTLREADTAARIGGDEFIIVLTHLTHHFDPAVVAEKILHSLSAAFRIQGQLCHIGASIGISLFPDDSRVPDTLITFSDNAMYRAKEQGKNNYQFYSAPPSC